MKNEYVCLEQKCTFKILKLLGKTDTKELFEREKCFDILFVFPFCLPNTNAYKSRWLILMAN